jgi:hypothetical protein
MNELSGAKQIRIDWDILVWILRWALLYIISLVQVLFQHDLLGQELLIIPEHMSPSPLFAGSVCFFIMFCTSLWVIFWSLYCQFFFCWLISDYHVGVLKLVFQCHMSWFLWSLFVLLILLKLLTITV